MDKREARQRARRLLIGNHLYISVSEVTAAVADELLDAYQAGVLDGAAQVRQEAAEASKKGLQAGDLTYIVAEPQRPVQRANGRSDHRHYRPRWKDTLPHYVEPPVEVQEAINDYHNK